MILESIVTSRDAQGCVNIAPMGPVVDEDPQAITEGTSILLRPFDSSQTYKNLLATGKAVIHVTDDADLFARAATGAIDSQQTLELVQQIDDTGWWRLNDCHRWFAVDMVSVHGDGPRFDLTCRVVQSGTVRPFFGFNRAKFAVIEAAILATRTHLLPEDQIRDQLDRLRPLIDKTGGAVEHSAFAFLQKTIDDRIHRR